MANRQQIEKAMTLTVQDVTQAFHLYHDTFHQYWVPHNRDPRLDALEALEAVKIGKPH